MIIDAREMDNGRRVRTDICIIGAGAAGIMIALEFANRGIDVCLLESGGLAVDRRTQRLQSIHNIGRKYNGLRFLRPRYFGGATNLWGGHCVPLRALNFERVPWIPYSGWPFGIDEIQPYYERAHRYLDLGDYDYDPVPVAEELGMPLFPFSRDKVETVMSRYMGQTKFDARRFGIYYRDHILHTGNIASYTYANVTSINRDQDSPNIRDVSLKTLTGKRFSVSAKQYVLAAGGIENARLLLLSDGVQANGLGNDRDLVGRFFMEHIWYRNGKVLPHNGHKPLRIYGAPQLSREGWVQCHLALPEAVIREHQIPDFRAEITINTPSIFDRVVEFMHDARKNLMDIDTLDTVALMAFQKYRKRFKHFVEAHAPIKEPIVYRLSNFVEQIPNPDSRIQLSDKLDALGLRKATIDWRISPQDKEGIGIAHRLVAEEVDNSGFGRMLREMPEDEPEILYGASGAGHHMGTTRMHIDPHQGVVDENCQIHGLNNIYIAGSSVFPTSGFANPTLTIIALAIRLADHLKRVVRQ